jgi:hypothetical protein
VGRGRFAIRSGWPGFSKVIACMVEFILEKSSPQTQQRIVGSIRQIMWKIQQYGEMMVLRMMIWVRGGEPPPSGLGRLTRTSKRNPDRLPYAWAERIGLLN